MLIYIMGVVLLVVILNFYLKKNSIHFISSLFPIYSFISIYISTLYIDLNRVYSGELSKYIGGETYSAFTLLLYLILFIFSSKLVFTKKRKNKIIYFYQKNINKKYLLYGYSLYTIIAYIVFIYLIIIFLHMLTTKLPIISGIDRVEYYRNHASFLYIILIKLLNILGILLGILYVYSQKNRHMKKIIKYSFYLFLIILFLAGNKFSTPLRFILFYLFPIGILYINFNSFKNIPIKKVIMFFLGIFIFIFIFLQYISMFFGDRLLSDYLIDRLMIAQGQLWWDYYNQYFYFNWSIDNLYHAFENTFINPLYDFQGNKFLLYLMEQTIDKQQLLNRMENGYLYTGAYPAFVVILLSPIGSIIFHFILSLLYSLILYYFYIFLVKRMLFTAIMIAYFQVSILFIFVTSDFGHLYTYILKILLIIIAFIIDKSLTRRKK